MLGLPFRWGISCLEGEGAVPPPELPLCLLWPLILPIVSVCMGPQEGCLGLEHREGRAIYSKGRHPPFLLPICHATARPQARPGPSGAPFQFLKQTETALLALGFTTSFQGPKAKPSGIWITSGPGKKEIALAISMWIVQGVCEVSEWS